MATTTLTYRRYGQDYADAETTTFRTADRAEAFRRLAKRHGWPGVGLVEHFPGGSTYHVQFGRPVRGGGTSLSGKYIVRVD